MRHLEEFSVYKHSFCDHAGQSIAMAGTAWFLPGAC